MKLFTANKTCPLVDGIHFFVLYVSSGDSYYVVIIIFLAFLSSLEFKNAWLAVYRKYDIKPRL